MSVILAVKLVRLCFVFVIVICMITTPPSPLDGSFEKSVSAWDIGMNSKKCYVFKSYWSNPKQEKASFTFDILRFNRISKVEERFERYIDCKNIIAIVKKLCGILLELTDMNV